MEIGKEMVQRTDKKEDELAKFKALIAKDIAAPVWPGFKATPVQYDPANGYRRSATMLQISELDRLMLKWDDKISSYRTSPFAMPDVQVPVIELVGTIQGTKSWKTFLQLRVCDGTKIMTVNYDNEEYQERYVKHGKSLRVGDYISAVGFLMPLRRTDTFAGPRASRILEPRIFTAEHLDAIDQRTYVEKFKTCINEGMKKYR